MRRAALSGAGAARRSALAGAPRAMDRRRPGAGACRSSSPRSAPPRPTCCPATRSPGRNDSVARAHGHRRRRLVRLGPRWSGRHDFAHRFDDPGAVAYYCTAAPGHARRGRRPPPCCSTRRATRRGAGPPVRAHAGARRCTAGPRGDRGATTAAASARSATATVGAGRRRSRADRASDATATLPRGRRRRRQPARAAARPRPHGHARRRDARAAARRCVAPRDAGVAGRDRRAAAAPARALRLVAGGQREAGPRRPRDAPWRARGAGAPRAWCSRCPTARRSSRARAAFSVGR